MRAKAIKDNFLYFLYLLLTVTLIFAGAEVFVKYILGYRTITDGETTCKVSIDAKGFSTYKPNCFLVSKHWEQKDHIRYSFNENGRRDAALPNDSPTDLPLVASIGDSFTLGAMVPIEKNYNYMAFYGEKPQKQSAILHNYGVTGEQINNVASKLRTENFSQYEYILYGLTPNDFFYLLDRNIVQSSEFDEPKENNIKYLKKLIYASGLASFISHNLMKNDNIYLNVYTKRKPYSGYLDSMLSDEWKKSMELGFLDLHNLPAPTRKKLKIFLLPQRAEVAASRVGSYRNAFTDEFYTLCKRFEFDCRATNISDLSNVGYTHFPIDGHLTVEGNKAIANQLRDWSNTWDFKKWNK